MHNSDLNNFVFYSRRIQVEQLLTEQSPFLRQLSSLLLKYDCTIFRFETEYLVRIILPDHGWHDCYFYIDFYNNAFSVGSIRFGQICAAFQIDLNLLPAIDQLIQQIYQGFSKPLLWPNHGQMILFNCGFY